MSNDPKDSVVDVSKLMKSWQTSNKTQSSNKSSSSIKLITSCNENARLDTVLNSKENPKK